MRITLIMLGMAVYMFLLIYAVFSILDGVWGKQVNFSILEKMGLKKKKQKKKVDFKEEDKSEND